MSISVFMLYVILKKIIDQHRRLIGTMKAFGFHTKRFNARVHKVGVCIGLIGALLAVYSYSFGQSDVFEI